MVIGMEYTAIRSALSLINIKNGLSFWYRLIEIILEKKPFNQFNSTFCWLVKFCLSAVAKDRLRPYIQQLIGGKQIKLTQLKFCFILRKSTLLDTWYQQSFESKRIDWR